MATLLPVLASRPGSSGPAHASDQTLFNVDKSVPDDRLGHAPRGSVKQDRPNSPSITNTARQDPPEGVAGLEVLAPAMQMLDEKLREALQELNTRNTSVIQAMSEASTLPNRPRSAQAAGAGALIQAVQSPSVNPGSPSNSSTMQAKLLASGRLSAALMPTRSAGGMNGVDSGLASTQGVGSPRVILGPRWGATEGGRDNLGWVRSLIKYTESSPLMLPEARNSDLAADASSTGFRKSTLPSLKADRREDAVLLARWLQDMVGQLSTQQAAALAGQIRSASAGSGAGQPTSSSPAHPPGSVMEMAAGVLQVYQVAFEELKRQVSTECKERGVLLDTLWEHWSSMVELRTNLAAELRLGAVQEEYAALLESRAQLSSDVSNLQASLAAAEKEVDTTAKAGDMTSRSLATKLAAAQAHTEVANSHYKIADLALNNEVGRRLDTEKQLETTKQLLLKSEHEWLAFRALVQRLESDNANLQKELDKARQELDAAAAAADTAHDEFAALLEKHISNEVELSRMKREYETDEILLVSFKQQVRDLEGQVAQLKAFQRDQALKLGAVAADKEALESDKSALQEELATSQEHAASLAKSLAETEAALAQCQQELQAKIEAYDVMEKEKDAQLADVSQQLSNTMIDLRQTNDKLSDTEIKLLTSESARREMDTELASLREMLNGLCRTMEPQGVDETTSASDKSWTATGPTGAAQRTLMVAGRHVAGLWERLEASKQEVAVLSERLEVELALRAKLQDELHASRTQEAKVLNEKEVVELQLDVAHQAKRVLEAEALNSKAEVAELQRNVTRLEGIEDTQRQELEVLRPLVDEERHLRHQIEDLSESLRVTSSALLDAKEDIARLTQQVEYYTNENGQLMSEITTHLERIKELTVYQVEAGELSAQVKELVQKLDDTQEKLDAALESHANTLHQLEIARFFLQGLDLVPPQSPASSTASQPVASPTRQIAGDASSNSNSPAWRPTTAPSTLQTRPASAGPSRLARSSQGGPAGDSGAQVLTLEAVEEEHPSSPTQVMSFTNIRAPSIRDLTYSSGSFGGSRPGSRGSDSPSAILTAAGVTRHSRPSSAVSVVSNGTSIGSEVPQEVVTMMEERGLTQKTTSSPLKWMRFKLQIMASFTAKLRAQLLAKTEQCAQLEVQLVEAEVNALQAAVAREKVLSDEILSSVRGEINRSQHEVTLQLSALREDLPSLKADLGSLCAVSTHMGIDLKHIQDALKQRQDATCQVSDLLEPGWASFIQSLPMDPPLQPFSDTSLGEAIVRIYLRALPSVEAVPVWGSPRIDTVYDAVMEHYTSQVAPGTFEKGYLKDIEGPIGRMLRCVRTSTTTRAAVFGCLTGVSPDGTVWPPQSWHFLLHLLHCLKLLLAGTWQTTCKAWVSHTGAQIPVQAVYDLVGNLYNVQAPQDLGRAVLLRLSSIVLPGHSGPQVDLDALLLLLITEYNAGACPRAALLYPRRLTDGTLFNLFNTLGNLPQVAAIADGRVEALMSTFPMSTSPLAGTQPAFAQATPGSPTSRPMTGARQQDGQAAEALAVTTTSQAAARGVISRQGWIRQEHSRPTTAAAQDQFMSRLRTANAALTLTTPKTLQKDEGAPVGSRNLAKGGIVVGPPQEMAHDVIKSAGPGALLYP